MTIYYLLDYFWFISPCRLAPMSTTATTTAFEHFGWAKRRTWRWWNDTSSVHSPVELRHFISSIFLQLSWSLIAKRLEYHLRLACCTSSSNRRIYDGTDELFRASVGIHDVSNWNQWQHLSIRSTASTTGRSLLASFSSIEAVNKKI